MAYEEISPISYPITMIKGDDWNREILVYASDGVTPFVLTGWSAKAEVRKTSKGDVTPVITFDSTASTMLLEDGKITLIAAKANTVINPTNYIWDCEFIDPDGKTRTLIKSSLFSIIEDVTQ